MQAKYEGYRKRVIDAFNAQGLVHTLGISIDELGEGWFHTRMVPNPGITQQHGYVHAGAIATIADLSSGFAAYSLMAEDEDVLTIEFKINLLRPAIGDLIICRARVLKPGNIVTVSESEVFAVHNDTEKLVAKATVTLAVLKNKGDTR